MPSEDLMHVYMVLQIGFVRSTISSAELGDRAHPIGSMNSAFLFREPDSEESGAPGGTRTLDLLVRRFAKKLRNKI